MGLPVYTDFKLIPGAGITIVDNDAISGIMSKSNIVLNLPESRVGVIHDNVFMAAVHGINETSHTYLVGL